MHHKHSLSRNEDSSLDLKTTGASSQPSQVIGTRSRRSVLRAGLASAGVLASGVPGISSSSLAATSSAHEQMHLGLVTYLWGKDMGLEELINNCEASGLLGVEVRTQHKHGVEPALNEAERIEVRKRFADSRVELIGYGSNCEYHSADSAKVKSNIEQTKEFIRLMHDCGGTGVKVKPNGFDKGMSREKTIEQIGRSLNEVAAYGEGFGQKIRVEVHGRGTSSLKVIKDVFDVADHPNVYVCWNCNDEDLADGGLEENFDLVRSRFGDTIHVREMNVGNYPYGELMTLLVESKYEGWILLEARTNPDDKVKAMVEQRQLFEKFTNREAN
ncbi:MAG: sugar phosphate isomerase/epimerase family protein [Pirellulaceae bacterium]